MKLEFYFQTIDILMERGADLSSDDGSVLNMAIDTGRVDLIMRMVEGGADLDFESPLAHCMATFEDPAAGPEKRKDMEEIAMILIEHGANQNIEIGVNREPALTVAGLAGRAKLTKLLINKQPNKAAFDERDRHGRPAMHRFLNWLEECEENDIEKQSFLELMVLELIRNVDEDSIDVVVDGLSPLDIAMQCNNGTITYALLQRGATFGPSALLERLVELNEPGLKAAQRKFLEETACNLIRNNAPVNIGMADQTPFDLTYSAGSAKVFKEMLDHGLDVHHGPGAQSLAQVIAAEVGIQTTAKSDRMKFLTVAAMDLSAHDPSILHELLDSTNGSVPGTELALHLIKQSEISMNARRETDGAAPLHCAASAGAVEVMRAILAKEETNPNALDHHNQTPMIFASVAGQYDCIALLLVAGADTSVAGGQHLRQMTALHEAALGGNAQICQILIEAGAPVDAQAYWQRTPLHLAVVGGLAGEDAGRLACVQVLVKGGCSVNAKDLDMETGLSYAVERGYHEVSALLLKEGADPCGADIHGNTPIHHCVESHDLDIFQTLLASRPHDIQVLGLLAPAIRAGFKAGIEPLAQPCGEISTADSLTGMTASANIGGWAAPLWNACYFGQPEIAESFLSQVTDLNQKDHSGFTLLHRLIHWGGKHHTALISTLLQRGASPNVRDRYNCTPLQVAARLGNAEAAQALKQGGASASQSDIQASQDAGDTAVYLMTGTPDSSPLEDCSSISSAMQWCASHPNTKFLDPNFAPCLGSLVTNIDNTNALPGRYHDVEWIRASDACSGRLLGSFDVEAGPLGDPFFIATLPDDPSAAFPGQSDVSANGVYEVLVQFMGEKHRVVVDDFVPAIDGKPVTVCSKSNNIWPLIYEKACAKVAGSYQALSALRHGELSLSQGGGLADNMHSSTRRQHEVNNFLTPSLTVARLGGFASDEESLARFAEEFSRAGDVDLSKMLKGQSRPMTTVGNFDMMQFAIRSPAKILALKTDTWIKAECTLSQATADTCTVSLCVAEILSTNKWRLVSGSVSTHGQTSVVVEVPLEANGSKFLVFVGVPSGTGREEPEIALEISFDEEVKIQDA